MTLPPERISIKRRRQDEPVDTLILEQGVTHDKKRQFTDFFFQRLQLNQVAVAISRIQAADVSPSTLLSRRTADDYKKLGIPIVKSSAPDDQSNDHAKLKAVQEHNDNTLRGGLDVAAHGSQLIHDSSPSSSQQQRAAATTRRFHLTRDISSSLNSNQVSDPRRLNASLRPPLATFVERHEVQTAGSVSIHRQSPVDRIVELGDKTSESLTTTDPIGKRTQINTFVKSSAAHAKRGVSIRDDPTTWDHDSDQLANELAALAFDIDPADATEPPQAILPHVSTSVTAPPAVEPMIVDQDDDYVVETYIRVKRDPNMGFPESYHNIEVGVLVIDDENEDLWERYVRSDDDDDDWDEEDEDSNAEDNPRNEYPDDEVSSDDEFGRNLYKYRRHASDDEEFDGSQHGW